VEGLLPPSSARILHLAHLYEGQADGIARTGNAHVRLGIPVMAMRYARREKREPKGPLGPRRRGAAFSTQPLGFSCASAGAVAQPKAIGPRVRRSTPARQKE